jgi:hypothetical protein
MLDSLIVYDAVAQMGLQRCLATSCSMIAHVLISRLRRSRLIYVVDPCRQSFTQIRTLGAYYFVALELAAWKATCIVDLEESISVCDMIEYG